MAAPIYRDEFERRFMEMIGFVNTSIESQRIKITQDINANTDTKFAAVIANADAKFAAVIAHYDREIAELKQEIVELRQESRANNQLLRAIAQALNINNI